MMVLIPVRRSTSGQIIGKVDSISRARTKASRKICMFSYAIAYLQKQKVWTSSTEGRVSQHLCDIGSVRSPLIHRARDEDWQT